LAGPQPDARLNAVPKKQGARTPEIGEPWAYRARAVDRLDEVEVVRFGAKAPPRVLVRFVAPEHEGREDWVPPGRLKVPWELQAAFLTHERQWAEVRAVAYLRETRREARHRLRLRQSAGLGVRRRRLQQ
jgi:hypothetical protein